MIQPGSLAGFALVYFVLAWTSSAVLAGAVLAAGKRLRRLGPRTERALVSTALLAPPLAALALVLSMAWLSLAEARSPSGDHCGTHAHHLHLCLMHGRGWGESASVLGAVGLFSAVTLTRAFRRIREYLVTAALVRDVERHGEHLSEVVPGVLLVPSEGPLCLTAGLTRPRILISTRVWDLLASDERQAVLAHEKAHIEHGDIRWRFALDLVSTLGAPGFVRQVLGVWDRASERLCDRRAALAVTEPAVVANAIVRVVRLATTSREPRMAGVSSFALREAIEERVEALLRGEPEGDHHARRALVAVSLTAFAFASAAVLFADPLHHVLENLLTFS